MSEILHGAAIVGQSGGPTAAINATLAGVIKGFFEKRDVISKLYGMKNGMEGLLAEKIYDLGKMFENDEGELDNEKLTLLSQTPAAALGSCRKKLPNPDDDRDFYVGLIDIFKKYDIRYFFYIGGNDSMDTVAKLTKYLKCSDYKMCVMGIPKTIDNDLCATDHTPGYGSAAKYIAAVTQEVIRDCAVYTMKAVTIIEIMGRDAGWLTAAAALPRLINGTEIDCVYLPEVTFSIDRFYSDIEKAFAKHPNVVIAVSEGIKFDDGHYVGEGKQSGSADVFGHRYLSGTGKVLESIVKEHFGCKVRSIELNLPQRCASHMASAADIFESQTAGETAVIKAIDGVSGCMISFVRANGKYEISYEAKDISEIANAVRNVPREYITDDGSNVTDECLEYIKPLIAGEIAAKYENGLPVHYIIENKFLI